MMHKGASECSICELKFSAWLKSDQDTQVGCPVFMNFTDAKRF